MRGNGYRHRREPRVTRGWCVSHGDSAVWVWGWGWSVIGLWDAGHLSSRERNRTQADAPEQRKAKEEGEKPSDGRCATKGQSSTALWVLGGWRSALWEVSERVTWDECCVNAQRRGLRYVTLLRAQSESLRRQLSSVTGHWILLHRCGGDDDCKATTACGKHPL